MNVRVGEACAVHGAMLAGQVAYHAVFRGGRIARARSRDIVWVEDAIDVIAAAIGSYRVAVDVVRYSGQQ